MTIIGFEATFVPQMLLPMWSAPHLCGQWREIVGSRRERTALGVTTWVIEQCEVCGDETERPAVDSVAGSGPEDPRRAGVAALMSALWPGLGKPPAWQDRGTCAGMEPRVFDRTNRLSGAVCGACPVRVQCLTDQVRWEAETGRTSPTTTATVRGGLTATDRVIHHLTTTSRENNTTFSRENTTADLAA